MSESFSVACEELFAKIGKGTHMVLATCMDNKPTARNVCVVVHQGKLYCQTDKTMRKFNHLTQNPSVALCVDNIQLEGECRPIGHPLLRQNQFFIELYKECFPKSYVAYSALKDEVVLEIELQKALLWNYRDGKPVYEKINFAKEEYTRRPYIAF